MEISKTLCLSSRTENGTIWEAGKNTEQQKCFFQYQTYILGSAAIKLPRSSEI